MFKFYYSDQKEQFFWIDKRTPRGRHFADVASSYIKKMQRSIAKKADAARMPLQVES